jgi:hypothetical protein
MPLDDQIKNLENELSSLQAAFEKCVADGDVSGFTRAKAKIKKLEVQREKMLNDSSTENVTSTVHTSNGIDFQPAANKNRHALDTVEIPEVPAARVSENSSGQHMIAGEHSHSASSQVRPKTNRATTDDVKVTEPRHIEGALLDEFDHNKPKPAQSLAMLLLQSLERSALAENGLENFKTEDGKTAPLGTDEEISVATDALAIKEPEEAKSESTAEGLVDELLRLAGAADGEKRSQDERSVSSEAVLETIESASEVLAQFDEGKSEVLDRSVAQIDDLQPDASNTSEAQISPESVDKMRQLEVKPTKNSAPPANSAKKEIAKFWKFITKPEEFMEDQNAQEAPGDGRAKNEPKK